MRTLTAFLALWVAQNSPEDLLKKKLQSPFLSKAPWMTDYDKARAESERSGKPILAYFTMSYQQCEPCTRLEGSTFLSAEFGKVAEKYVLLCHVTSQVQGEKYPNLMTEKGGTGFPYVAFLDSEGNVLVKQADHRSAEALDQSGAAARAFVELKARAAKGDAATKIDYILARLELDQIKLGEAEVRIRETGGRPSEPQQKRLDQAEVNAEIESLLGAVKSEEAKTAAAKKCYQRRKDGKPAPTKEPWMGYYWNLVLEQAEMMRDVPVFEESLGKLKEKYSSVPNAQRYLQEKEGVLKKFKEEKK